MCFRPLAASLLAVLLLAGCTLSSTLSADSVVAVEPPFVPDPTPAYAATPPVLDLADVEKAVHRAVNRARRRRGRAPLAWSDSLHRLAQRHSRDMARRGFFAHVTPDSVGPALRAQRLGLPITRAAGGTQRVGIGENLYRTLRYRGHRDVPCPCRGETRRAYDWKPVRQIAQQAVRGWLRSPAHRRTLLSHHYRQHGLGVALSEQRVYVTENLF